MFESFLVITIGVIAVLELFQVSEEAAYNVGRAIMAIIVIVGVLHYRGVL